MLFTNLHEKFMFTTWIQIVWLEKNQTNLICYTVEICFTFLFIVFFPLQNAFLGPMFFPNFGCLGVRFEASQMLTPFQWNFNVIWLNNLAIIGKSSHLPLNQ